MPDQQSPFVTNNNPPSSSATPPPLRPAPTAAKPPLEAPHDLPVASGSFNIPGMPPSTPAVVKPSVPPLTPPPVASTPSSTTQTSQVAPKPLTPSPAPTPAPAPLPPKPATPTAPQPAPLSPQPTAPAPAPSVPATPAPAAAPQNISSSIRTMQSDLEALKQGKTPTGIPIEKKPEAPMPSATPSSPSASGFTPPKPVAPPATPTAPQPAPLSPKPITPTPIPTAPLSTPTPKPAIPSPVTPAPTSGSSFSIPTTPAPSSTAIPPKPLTPATTPTPPPSSAVFTPPSSNSGSHTKLLGVILAIVILAIAGVSIWLYISNNSEVATTSPSATPSITTSQTPTPTPSVLALASVLGTPDNLALPANADPQLTINAVVNSVSLTPGGIRTFRILDSDNVTPLALKDFLAKMLITTPTQTSSASAVLATKNWVLGVYGQVNTDTPNATTPVTKKMFLVADVGTNISGASQLLQIWETTLINDFANLFRYTKPAKPLKFIGDSYSGVPFRYVQIPDKYSGIGYTVVSHYLFLESSRDTFRTILSRLLTTQ